jgi:hypothetical protein
MQIVGRLLNSRFEGKFVFELSKGKFDFKKRRSKAQPLFFFYNAGKCFVETRVKPAS